MLILLAIALAIYGTARYYSQSLVLFVVEQTLLQRSPSGTDPGLLRRRLETHLAASPSQDSKMAELLNLSLRLEKVQALSQGELEELLK
jgi:hypothetical protein